MPIKEIDNEAMPSLTEWLEQIGHKDAAAFRLEDNTKRNRLEVLYQTVGLNYDRPERLTARDIADETPIFQDVLCRKGDAKCALRLVPTEPELPKLRVRGKTLRENLVWFQKQKIDPDKYKVEVVPHPDEPLYAAIFFVNDKGAFGEIVPGWHWQLTQGLHDHHPVAFSFDFTRWQLSEPNHEVFQIVKDALSAIRILEENIQTELAKKIAAEFTSHGYIQGYFEFVVLQTGEIQFIDYNRVLPRLLHDAGLADQNEAPTQETDISGICASPGTATGRVKIVFNPTETDFSAGDILICPMTTVDYLPLMQKAAAIVTDQGNILSHAAIVSRELGKPCVVGTGKASKLLRNGESVKVIADRGLIHRLGH